MDLVVHLLTSPTSPRATCRRAAQCDYEFSLIEWRIPKGR